MSAPPGYAGPRRLEGVREIADLEELGRIDGPHRLRLGAPLRSRPHAPLFQANDMPQRVRAEHLARWVVPGASVLAVPGHELGGFGLLRQGGEVLVDELAQPGHIHAHLKPDSMPPHWARGLFAADAEIVESDAPVGVALNPHLVWGHFLLEMLARVHLLAMLRDLGRLFRLALPADAPPWVAECVGLYFAPDEILAYDSMRQRVRAPHFVLPAMMMANYHLHPAMNQVVAETLRRAGATQAPDAPRRLYLSRARHPGWHGPANEAEIERALADLGFAALHPQEHDLRAQLALYAGAEAIVAHFSSAAHNALFAPRGAAVACFGWMNRCQSGIANLRGQPLAHLPWADGSVMFPPPGHPTRDCRLPVDIAALARDLPRFLAFAARRRAG